MLAAIRRALDTGGSSSSSDYRRNGITRMGRGAPGVSFFAETQEDTIADTDRVCNRHPLLDDVPANEGAPQGNPAQGIGLQPGEQRADPVDPADNDGLDPCGCSSSGAGASSGRRESTSVADRSLDSGRYRAFTSALAADERTRLRMMMCCAKLSAHEADVDLTVRVRGVCARRGRELRLGSLAGTEPRALACQSGWLI
jgi:hypothetical protein